MKMIIFGWGKKVINLGFVKTEHCQTCNQNRNFVLSLVYRYFALFWIPIISWEKKYYYHCDVCNRGTELDKQKVKQYLTRNPIPWYHRFGWLVLIAIIALAATLVITLTPNSLSLKGQVIYTNGKPADNCTVYIFKANELTSYAATSVDSKGYYSFKNLPSGSYEIYAVSSTTKYVTGDPDAVVYVYDAQTTTAPTITFYSSQ